MKAVLMDLLADQPDGFKARSTAREYLQARILLALQDHGAFTDWAFRRWDRTALPVSAAALLRGSRFLAGDSGWR